MRRPRAGLPRASQAVAPTPATECVPTVPLGALYTIIEHQAVLHSTITVKWREAASTDRRWLTWIGEVIESKFVDPQITDLGRLVMVKWMHGDRLEELCLMDDNKERVEQFPPPDVAIEVANIDITPPRPGLPTEGTAAPNYTVMRPRLPAARPRVEAATEFFRDATAQAAATAPVLDALQRLGANINDLQAFACSIDATVHALANQQARIALNLTQLMTTMPTAGGTPAARSYAGTASVAAPDDGEEVELFAPTPSPAKRADAASASASASAPAAAAAAAGASASSKPATVAAKKPPAKTSSKRSRTIASPALEEMLSCNGESCCNSCVDIRRRGQKDAYSELKWELERAAHEPPHQQVVKWMVAHKLVRPAPAVCGHKKTKEGAETTTCTSEKFYLSRSASSAKWVCANRECGHSLTMRPPNRPWSLWGELHFTLFHLAKGTRLHSATIPGFDAGNRLVKLLCEAAAVINAERYAHAAYNGSWMNIQWDETFHAQRKYQRGHRVRLSGTMTFVGGVTMVRDPDGTVRIAEGVVAGVANKSREQQLALLLALAAPGASVATDAASMYRDLKSAGIDHVMVNHSKEFVAADGTHTNAIEGFWSVIKRKLRAWWSHQPKDTDVVNDHFQLAAFFANAGFAGLSQQAAAVLLLRKLTELEEEGTLQQKYAAAKHLLCTPPAAAFEAQLELAAQKAHRAEGAASAASAPVARVLTFE